MVAGEIIYRPTGLHHNMVAGEIIYRVDIVDNGYELLKIQKLYNITWLHGCWGDNIQAHRVTS